MADVCDDAICASLQQEKTGLVGVNDSLRARDAMSYLLAGNIRLILGDVGKPHVDKQPQRAKLLGVELGDCFGKSILLLLCQDADVLDFVERHLSSRLTGGTGVVNNSEEMDDLTRAISMEVMHVRGIASIVLASVAAKG